MNATNHIENHTSIQKSQRIVKKSQSEDDNTSPDDEM